jgi:transcriptional regulator with XRE-family HTH domain
MNEINRRYFDALLMDRGMSLRDLAKVMKKSHSQLSLALNGARKFQAEELVQISNIFGEPIVDVMGNAGLGVRPLSGRRASVVGTVKGDGTIEPLGPDVIERAVMPEELPDDTQAVQCRTAGSPLDWTDGSVSFFRTPNGIDPGALGRLSVCKIQGGPVVISNVKRGYKDNTYNLFYPYQAESVALEWASPVLMTRH